MKQTKRILSVLICLAMVLSLLSVVTFAATPDILYFQPNSEWTQAGARFALWTWSGSGSGSWTTCIDSDGDGIYEADIPDGHNMVIFARMSPNGSIDWGSKWNQSGDISIPTDGKNLYIQKKGDWDCKGTWDYFEIPECYHENHDQTGLCPDCGETIGHSFVEHVCICGLVEPTIAEPGYYLVGSFNGGSWFVNETSADRLMTEIDDGVFEIVYNFAAGELFKIVSYDGYAIGTWYGAAQGGDADGNYICAEEGELTLHFEEAHHTAYFYHGCDHAEHDADGFCVNCGEEVGHSYEGNVCPGCGHEIEQLVIFFRNDWNWSDVKIYYWGSVVPSVDWPGEAMYEYEGNIYSYVIPVDVDGFKIHGLDGEAEKDTGDIVENIAEGNCYYMNWTEELGEHVCVIDINEALNPPCDHAEHDQDGICLSCGETVDHSFVDGVCSCGKTEEVVVPSVNYIVAGSPDLCGAGSTDYGWDPSDLSNLMTDNGDGTFSKVYSNVLPGDGYELKIVEEIDGNYTWIGVDGGADNMIFNVTDTCDVTVTFNPETKEITVTGEYVVLPGSELEVEFITVTGNGDGTWLNGASWDPADLSNQMDIIYQDYYVITYYNVEGFDNYQVKFTADGSWAHNWGGVYEGSGTESDAVYNGDNITITVPYELATVTIFLDLMNYDHSTKTGAKFTVYVTENDPVCEHTSHDQDGNCVDCGEPVEHDYVDGFCSCGAADPDYVPPCDHVEHDMDGNCTNCGEYVGHSFDENYACACGKTIETVTVYFQNNWLWREVSIFFWGSELADPVWPGYSMEFYNNDGLYDIYSYNIPVDVDGVIINGKKDDGSNTLDQTPDITEGFYDGICYYMTWDDGNAVGSLNVEMLFCEHENHDQEGNCTNCGTAVEHVYEAVVTNPDCVNPGYTTYTCACGSEYTDNETDPVHGDIIHVEAVAATCYDNGNIEHWFCEICGQAWLDAECTLNTNLKAVVLPKGHGDIIHVEAVAATCYDDGNIEYWYCGDCGQAWLDAECTLNTNLKSVILPKSHGDIIHVEAVAADCYADGNIEYWYCDTCGQAWLDAECTLNTNLKSVILPKGHGEITHMEAIAANCYLDGNIEYWFCEACGQAWLDADCIRNTNLMAVILPSQGHSFADGFCGICGEADPDYVEPEEPVEQPTKVENVTIGDVTKTSFSVSWDAVDGAVKYWVYINNSLYISTTGTSVEVTGRKVNTDYTVYVIANFDDVTFMKAEDAEVWSVITENYSYECEIAADNNSIAATWTAEDCGKAWFYYGTSADSLVLYASSKDGNFYKGNLKSDTTYFVQIAYLIDGKIIYGDIMQIDTVLSNKF